MDWLEELIGKQVDDGYSDKAIASAIREEIRKMKPRNREITGESSFNLADDDMNVMKKVGYNIAIADYDKALGVYENKEEDGT